MNRYSKLLNRRIDPDFEKIASFSANENYQEIREGEDVKYALGAMQPIDPEYTKNTFKQCDRVQNQLDRAFQLSGVPVEFDHQGSATNNTHIRARSDIDLLTVVQRFYHIQPPNRPSIPYAGDPVADLRNARRITASKLTAEFPTATIDSTGRHSIKIQGGSLTREVDVVACAWWHTVEYVATGTKKWLGIGVLDNDAGLEIFNKPFLHNQRIDERDQKTDGKTRKAIRLLKSLKYDADTTVSLSSYDISSIVYNMYDTVINAPGREHDLHLLEKCDSWLNVLEYRSEVRDSIQVPNQTRKVFCSEGATLKGLQQLRAELSNLIVAVKGELAAVRHQLEEVTIPSYRPRFQSSPYIMVR